MNVKAIHTDEAPAAVGPYSQAVQYAGLLFTSGQLPLDPETGKMVEGDIAEQAHRVFKNLEAVARSGGTTLSKALKTTVFLSDIGDFQAINEVYKQYFDQPFPSRSAYQVAALPLGAAMEVEAIFAA
ncbi:MAG TPA: RidA family protein [Desulfopila sp.]|nr:RidA family protein [Desulfopila sp.]